jgi:hypothetical protein
MEFLEFEIVATFALLLGQLTMVVKDHLQSLK